MTTLLVPELDEVPWPTLGPLVCGFIEEYLVFGPGDLRGEPARLDAEKRALIPAVTHVNGSGRLQSVTETQNPRYYRLIKAFEAFTGVPTVLNTSFNENEPVVCKPQEALDCFLRTKMDVLVMGNWFVERREK